jgi:hypothetical protein
MPRPTIAALVGLLLASPLAAQRVLPVAEEPFHRTVLMTPAARMLDIRMQPGDSTQYHSHARPYFWVVIEGQGFDSQLPGGAPTPVAFAPGHVGFTAATESTPLIHRVLDRAPAGFHLVSAELIPDFTARCARSAPEPPLRGAEVVYDTLGVAVYRVRLAPGESLPTATSGAQLWISLSAGPLAWTPASGGGESATVLEAGQFLWQERRALVRNPGSQPISAVVLRWRECAAT